VRVAELNMQQQPIVELDDIACGYEVARSWRGWP